MGIPRVANNKDWLIYLEDGKCKAFDLGDHSNAAELRQLCRDTGTPVLGYAAFEHEKDALHYGEVVLRRD